MRTILLALTILGAVSAPVNAFAFGCGFKPFPPFGCDRNSAVCICDDAGNCRWIFVDCG